MATDGSAPKRRTHSRTADEDRISKLPDSVLCHILSFLPTKNSARTSVLSKRWKRTWTLVSDLDFEDSFCTNKKSRVARLKSFVNFVNRVLILHSHPCIKRFSLNLQNEFSNQDVDSWIFSAIAHSVEELNLSMEGMLQLPKAVYSCETLVVLKLSSEIDLRVPESVCLPKLKVLHLKHLQSLCDTCIDNLLTGCPTLENLKIDRHSDDDIQKLCVKSSSLKSLIIRTSIKNEDQSSIVVDARKLEFLELVVDWTHGRHLELSVLLDMLRNSPRLKVCILQICCDIGHCESLKEETSLDCWKYTLERLEFRNFRGSEGQLQILEYFMKNAEVLKKIRLQGTLYIYQTWVRKLLKKYLMLLRSSNKCEIMVS